MANKTRSPREVYVHFTREITGDTTEGLLDSMTSLANEGVPRVVLCLASPGGWVPKSMAIYNMLRAFSFELVTYNVGSVASAGNIVFLAGEKRYACPQASFMVHPSSFRAQDGMEFDAKGLRERIDTLDAHDERELQILKQRTKLTAARIKTLVRESTTIDAKDALEVGIVHQVKQLKIPGGARIVTAGFSRKPT